MDFKVASSIYRKPWLIESRAAIAYVELLMQIREGKGKFDKPKSTYQKLFASYSNVVVAPDNKYDAKNHPGYEGMTVAILPIAGPLMKEDFCGWYGTDSLHNEFKKIKNTESIKDILLVFDCPGGQVDGIEPFADSIREAGNVDSVIKGMCCSAAYFLASQSRSIKATARTDEIGSIGTMIQFWDNTQAMEDQGYVLRKFYATASKDKNKAFDDAVKGDGKLLIEEVLDPTNNILLDYVKNGRGDKLDQKKTLTGKVFLSETAQELGLIDGIDSMDNILTQTVQKHQTYKTMKFSLKATFTNILGFLGLKAEEGKETVELTEEQLGKIEAALPELETTRQKVTELEGTVATLTTERDTANQTIATRDAEIVRLNAEVERLGNLDAGKTSQPKAEGDKHVDDGEEVVDPMEMSFQKEIMDRL